jgi:signal transduction histidine kinase
MLRKEDAMKRFSWFGTILTLAAGLALGNWLSAWLALGGVGAALAALGVAVLQLLLAAPWLKRLGDIIAALASLAEGQTAPGLPIHRLDPLAGLASQVNALGAGERAGDVRSEWAQQAAQAAAQAERNRLARELHDSIKQQLFSIQMSVAAAEQRLAEDLAGARAALADARQRVAEAMVEMNSLLLQLSPAPLEKVGLAEAIREQCEALGLRTGAAVACQVGELPPDEWLPTGSAESLFRITQEALSNVARHARAHQVAVTLAWARNREQLELTIRDDGSGFDPRQAAAGTGLVSMRDRAASLGGQFALESSPGQGTELRVAIDVQPQEVDEGVRVTVDRGPNHAALLGLLGGGLVAACAVGPWYLTERARLLGLGAPFSPIWMAVGNVLGAAVLVGVGWLAARASKGGTGSGLVAGIVAGMTAYGLLGAICAGLLGARPLLAVGLGPVADESLSNALIAGGVARIFLWASACYWLALVSGALLGTLGGWLGRRRNPQGALCAPARLLDLLTLPVLLGGGLATLWGAFLLPVSEAGMLDVSSMGQTNAWPGLAGLVRVAVVACQATPVFFYLAAQVYSTRRLEREATGAMSGMLHVIQWRAFWLATGSAVMALATGGIGVAELSQFGYSAWWQFDNAALLFVFLIALVSLAFTFLDLRWLARVRGRMTAVQRKPTSWAVFAAIVGLPVVAGWGLWSLVSWSGGLLTLFLVVAEMFLLVYLAAAQPWRAGVSLEGLRYSRERLALLRGSWLLYAEAVLAPTLAMGASGLAVLAIVVRLAPIFDSGRLSQYTLGDLTMGRLVDQFASVGGVSFAAVWATALVFALVSLLVLRLSLPRVRRRL